MFQSNNYQHGLTVLITTYNAASLIEKTLEHLQTMRTIPNLPWEVLVVDNKDSFVRISLNSFLSSLLSIDTVSLL